MDNEHRDDNDVSLSGGSSDDLDLYKEYKAYREAEILRNLSEEGMLPEDGEPMTEQPDLRPLEDSSEIEIKRIKRKKKIEQRKKRKARLKKIRKILLILLAAVILAGILAWLFFSSNIFAVSEITVNHNTLKSDKNIIYESGIKVGENIFQYRTSKAKEAILSQNPYIVDVEISRKLPNKVIITVKEHAPVVAIKYNGQFLILDKNGKVAGVEKTQLTATRLTGVEVKHYTNGKVPVVQNSTVLKESLKLVNKINESGMFFKKLDVSSSMIVHGYITDDLECTGEAEDLIDNLEGIKAIIYDLNQKNTMKGTIYVGDDGYATFSPASSGSGTASASKEKTSASQEKKSDQTEQVKSTENKTDQKETDSSKDKSDQKKTGQ